MRVTIKDLAKYCGVSSGTVDRALNNRPGIKEKTKKLVLEAARELNYRPDFTARSLVKGKTMTLGIVLFDLYNRSFAQLLNAVEYKARENGYFIYIALSDKDPENEKLCIEYLANHKVDGIILFTVNQGKEFEDYLQGFSIPVITIFNYLSENWDYVGIKEKEAMIDGVGHIVDKGYKKFIYICPPLKYQGKTNIYTQEERLKGFLDGLSIKGINEVPLIIKHNGYLSELEEVTFEKNNKTAIVCSCDLYALEVMNFLKNKDIKIPEEVGLMGFDNIDVLKYISPKLTTVEYPVEQIGFRAVERLVNKIEDGEFFSEITPSIDYRIIVGEST
ncbi:LacI family DNA-binding transcriptional regulator [Bacillus sp. ISL-40]|uniref:LacI family DNA-binding transcriptional regulator n=1 Tax=unclassified Bacillus (in: firmicutes) TaxID=185979 RepID=UPI001BEB59BD|nr:MULTISPECIES: LacI family DNA-binding transcriptional regulator [unclassified Bacillus (in: firmicutes)]MBT2700510.1 LacI family DNA-binding transcriptional regulator [Bacillus sp. ISL-40]MBT2742778.1 LacI family DNA-binding transcriptional regulator [Bacillus sp. ISL-77]